MPWERSLRCAGRVLVYYATKSGQSHTSRPAERSSDAASIEHAKHGTPAAQRNITATGALATCAPATESPRAAGGAPLPPVPKQPAASYQAARLAARNTVLYLRSRQDDARARACADRMDRCALSLNFNERTDGSMRLAGGMFCGQFLLRPVCATRRARRLGAKYGRLTFGALNANPDARLYSVTLTVKGSTNLAASVTHLARSIQTLHQRGKEARRGKLATPTQAANVIGAVQSIEPHWNFEGFQVRRQLRWTPHVHGVWLCKGEPDTAALAREWRGITGDSHDVYVEPFHSYRKAADPGELEAALGGDFHRLFRYMLKFAELPEEVRWRAFTDLTRRSGRLPRLLSCRTSRRKTTARSTGTGGTAPGTTCFTPDQWTPQPVREGARLYATLTTVMTQRHADPPPQPAPPSD